ncbi:hypothetical protein SAY87_029122 [Trapa incisa]|uniref:GTP diphosphokinase n=1 Tax=Trapa incisa TaxID=236973 RepID=A0AAN7KQC7_9MYRT|nr:hypothetical protein SAY87_029122 [Trapa incisa]
MAPTIALYASPPSSVCSTTHQINSSVSYDFDLNSRPSTSSSASQKPIVGGLTCLFSSPSTVKSSSSSSFGEELGSFRHDKVEELKELSSSFGYSYSYSSSSKHVGSFKRDHHQSPVSVLQGSVSYNSSSSSAPNGSIRSPPMRILQSSTGLFNGFVRNALGSSCLDYESPAFEIYGGGSRDKGTTDMDELTFNLEGSFGEAHAVPEPYVEELLSSAQLRHDIFYDDFVVRAFYEAEKAHRGQMRASRDPYLLHCVETAVSLALIGANSTVVAAGLLHDALDDSSVTYNHILETFGADVADLVKGVSKLSELSQLARENNTANKTTEADRLHTMFLAMADARAVLIKLADRLHNMMTLGALPWTKQQRFAKETLEIFAPLANRLGISSWKEQLENLCFKHLYPEKHYEISSRLMESYNEAVIISSKEKLERALGEEDISSDLSGRHKSFYSIHCKMMKKSLTIDKIHDIHGLRLIVESEEDCYKALGVVHELWPVVPGKFKDYISHPKFNGYRSLHTVVMGEGKVPLEVQIRTREMHLQAEFGFAAHWRYKEGDCKHSSFIIQMVEWARWVISWQFESMSKDQSSRSCGSSSMKFSCSFPSHSKDCPFSYGACCNHDGPVFVIVKENDKMSVQELPANSTMMDLLERTGPASSRWSSYSFPREELRPTLNREPICDPACKLKMGDIVELTPALPEKFLTEYREEMQRMYNRGLTIETLGSWVSNASGWKSGRAM